MFRAMKRIRILDFFVQLAVVITFAWFLVYSFGTRVMGAGASMAPLLEQNELALINRVAYTFHKPRRFDVVAFRTFDGRQNVKRIIGLPGERVQIQKGVVYINGEALQEFAQAAMAGLAQEEIVLLDNEYFVLGDNRLNSEDSRFQSIGNISGDRIEGKLWLRLFPRFGWIS